MHCSGKAVDFVTTERGESTGMETSHVLMGLDFKMAFCVGSIIFQGRTLIVDIPVLIRAELFHQPLHQGMHL